MSGFARTWGQGAEPALLLHCSLAHSGAWDGVARALSDRLTLTAPDLVGHGRGPDRDPSRDIHDQATEAAALHLPERPCHLIGHSFGATVALRLALDHPERVASLTLIEPVLFAAAADHPAARAHDDAIAGLGPLIEAGDREGATRLFLSLWGGGAPLDAIPEAQRRYMIDRIWVVPASTPSLHHDSARLLSRLGKLTCPVLLIEGGESMPVISAIQTALGAAIPGHRRVVIGGAGHMAPLTHPGPVVSAVRDLLDGVG